MKAAMLIVLSLSALAMAGPAFNKNNDVDASNKARQQQYAMTSGDFKQSQATELLQKWCFASQLSQPELTSSFKKLVSLVKSSPVDASLEQAVMSERLCQGALVQKSGQTGETVANQGVDAKAHDLIKDVYMDALIACDASECTKQLVKIIDSQKVDDIRASYYMTRVAVAEQETVKSTEDVMQFADNFVQHQQHGQSESELVERQKMFATTAIIAKALKNKNKFELSAEERQQGNKQNDELVQAAMKVSKAICDRYIKPVTMQDVKKHQQTEGNQDLELTKKIAKRNAALQAINTLPEWIVKVSHCEQDIVQIVKNKGGLSTTRQSAIENLVADEQNEQLLKQIAFDQEEPIEVRVAAYRQLITSVWQQQTKDEQSKHQKAGQLIEQLVKHAERNQQQDDQFVLYTVSHLNNLRSSQQPEHQAIIESIAQNKQHYMQIQLLEKKLKQQLADVRKSSRNYKLEQEFNQIESGFVLEGDMIFESKNKQQSTGSIDMLPKVVRVNMSMPVMGETVNVVEITVRQTGLDEQVLDLVKLSKLTKFNSETVSKVVDQFKDSVIEQQQNQKQQQMQTGSKRTGDKDAPQADLTIKVGGCTVAYVSVDDFKTESSHKQHQRNTRSIYSVVDSLIEQLKRKPIEFNRGFNFQIQERLAKLIDIDAHLLAGLRFDAKARGSSANDFEVIANVEPRFNVEAIVGPAKMNAKKLLQRFSTKTAVGLRYRYKNNELVDIQIDLPMNNMELFSIESQLVEKRSWNQDKTDIKDTVNDSYWYAPESIYGQQDIYDASSIADDFYGSYVDSSSYTGSNKLAKRSLFQKETTTEKTIKSVKRVLSGKGFSFKYETSERVARATGLRTKLVVIASPRDMAFVSKCIVQKHDSNMQGYRVQVQKQRGQQSQFLIAVSTPGSRTDRTMQIQLQHAQIAGQRTQLKGSIVSPMMAATCNVELIHDGRQFAIKSELRSERSTQSWRHMIELGVQRSGSGRVGAATYKPFVSIDSTSMKRPVQMQGVVSYQSSPKTVISYELKSGSQLQQFIQGKLIVDSRNTVSQKSSWSRGMRPLSLVDLIAQGDLTLTSELVGQVHEHSFKARQMVDWNAQRLQLQFDSSCVHKNLRKDKDEQVQIVCKLSPSQQMVQVQRIAPQHERKEFRLTVQSDSQQRDAHQMQVELRYNGKRQSVVEYKHKIDYSSSRQGKLDVTYGVELVASEWNVDEKLQGRAVVVLERKQRVCQLEIASRNRSAKLMADWTSLEQHKFEMEYQCPKFSHKTQVSCSQRGQQWQLSSRTDKRGQQIAKLVLELAKPQRACLVLIELPQHQMHFAADLKLSSGMTSSIAVQTPRYTGKGEYSYETLSRPFISTKRALGFWMQPLSRMMPIKRLSLKTDVKDLLQKDAYWLDTQFSTDLHNEKSSTGIDKSFLRFDSPYYRSEFEFDPLNENELVKCAMFARQKRSISQFDKLYSSDESLLGKLQDKLGVQGTNKLWALRSIISGPSTIDQLKHKARRALVEFADRQQQHQHQFSYDPRQERVQMQLNREWLNSPLKPTRFNADLNTKNWLWTGEESGIQSAKPWTMSMDSDMLSFDLDTKPYDGQDFYAKLKAQSRNRRSAFENHESSWVYNKQQGHKAQMKHEWKHGDKHAWELEADSKPQKWAKIAYESPKHGKHSYQHKWRKYVEQGKGKRSADGFYDNMIQIDSSMPLKDLTQSGRVQWREPAQVPARLRRSIFDQETAMSSLIDALKRVESARIESKAGLGGKLDSLYKFDFDYQPEQHVRAQLDLDDDMSHAAMFELGKLGELKPHKLNIKQWNRRSQEPVYELKLATEQQLPRFFTSESLLSNPLQVDYTDKFGRQARFDLDHVIGGETKYAGLRQKRAALFYKDSDLEHKSSVDYYPQQVLGKIAKRVPGDLTMKADTKYGPVIVRVDSNDKMAVLEAESPIGEARLTVEQPSSHRQEVSLIKVKLSNIKQQVPLTKIVRKYPIVRDCAIVDKIARKFDQHKFEHETELLVNLIDAIVKAKSTTECNSRRVLNVEAELNKQQEKCVVKVDGARVQGQLAIDLVQKAASWMIELDDKRTVYHQTRVVPVQGGKFFQIESITSHKQQPLVKVNAKLSSMILREPEHLFSSLRRAASGKPSTGFWGKGGDEEISTIEAVVYEPKPVEIVAKFDCINKEAVVQSRELNSDKKQHVRMQLDQYNDKLYVEAVATNQRGAIQHRIQKAINIKPLVNAVMAY